MVDTKALVTRLIDEEGLRLTPYIDSVGKTTLGIGRNLSDVGISKKEAIYLCMNDIDNAISALRTNLSYFDSLPDIVQFVLADMTFNMGIYRLLQFKKTLSLIQNGDYKGASVEMLNSTWSKQVGVRALNLSNLLKSAI
jgi:lysozyme